MNFLPSPIKLSTFTLDIIIPPFQPNQLIVSTSDGQTPSIFILDITPRKNEPPGFVVNKKLSFSNNWMGYKLCILKNHSKDLIVGCSIGRIRILKNYRTTNFEDINAMIRTGIHHHDQGKNRITSIIEISSSTFASAHSSTICIWNYKTLKPISKRSRRYRQVENIYYFNKKIFAVYNQTNVFHIYSLNENLVISRARTSNLYTNVKKSHFCVSSNIVFHQSKNQMFLGLDNGNILTLSFKNRNDWKFESLQSWKVNKSPVVYLILSKDQKYLFSISKISLNYGLTPRETEIRIWNIDLKNHENQFIWTCKKTVHQRILLGVTLSKNYLFFSDETFVHSVKIPSYVDQSPRIVQYQHSLFRNDHFCNLLIEVKKTEGRKKESMVIKPYLLKLRKRREERFK